MNTEKIVHGNMTEEYTSISFKDILEKVNRFNGVKICNYQTYTSYVNFVSGSFFGISSEIVKHNVSKGKCIYSNGNEFEYPVWYNDEFGEGSKNAQNVQENEIKVIPRFSSRIFGKLCGKSIEDIVKNTKSQLRNFIDAIPIKENDTSMLYLEKIKNLEDGHLVRVTLLKIMDHSTEKIYVPAGPF